MLPTTPQCPRPLLPKTINQPPNHCAVEYVRVLADERVALVKYCSPEGARAAVCSLNGTEVRASRGSLRAVQSRKGCCGCCSTVTALLVRWLLLMCTLHPSAPHSRDRCWARCFTCATRRRCRCMRAAAPDALAVGRAAMHRPPCPTPLSRVMSAQHLRGASVPCRRPYLRRARCTLPLGRAKLCAAAAAAATAAKQQQQKAGYWQQDTGTSLAAAAAAAWQSAATYSGSCRHDSAAGFTFAFSVNPSAGGAGRRPPSRPCHACVWMLDLEIDTFRDVILSFP